MWIMVSEIISRAALNPGDRPLPQACKEPAYHADAALDEAMMRANEKEFALQAGVRLHAEFTLENMSALQIPLGKWNMQ